jgi:hypothetical protein
MDMINLETNDIRLSAHTPDFSSQTWIKLQNVDFTNIGIENISEEENRKKVLEIPRQLYIIENLVARWKTKDELYNFDEEKDKKIGEAKAYGQQLIVKKILELSNEMGENLYLENALWLLILQDKRYTTLKTYSNTVRTAVINKIKEINTCKTWDQLDAITIP